MTKFSPTAASHIFEHMTGEQKNRALREVPNVRSLLCAVFPYYCAGFAGRISLYARAKDYHIVSRKILEDKCAELSAEYSDNKFTAYLDSAVYPEPLACACAGLGIMGKNRLLLTEKYGSYVFCGLIATDLDLGGTTNARSCIDCGKCIDACPSGALGASGIDISRCVSHISQIKGELSPQQAEIMRAQSMIWGCDECQKCCPYNANVSKTDIPEFCESLVCDLQEDDIVGLSKKEFISKFPNRAFTWRGPAPLLRNIRNLTIK